MIFRFRRGLVLLFYSSSYLFEVQNDQIVSENDAFNCKKKIAEKEVFQWTTFIKRKQMRVFIRLAQNCGSTNEKLGFILWSLLFRSLSSSFNAKIVLNKYIIIPFFKARSNVIYFSKSVNLSLSHFLYQCFIYILLLGFHWIIIL